MSPAATPQGLHILGRDNSRLDIHLFCKSRNRKIDIVARGVGAHCVKQQGDGVLRRLGDRRNRHDLPALRLTVPSVTASIGMSPVALSGSSPAIVRVAD